jgi:Holliday junction resolvasome RuvABC endonuclease subunit
MILGLDISTSITGFAVIDDGELVEYGAVDLRKQKSLFDKSALLRSETGRLQSTYQFKHVFIEKPFTFFNSGGSSSKTMALLQRFNGMVSWIAYDQIGVKPKYISPARARKLCGIKVPKGQKAKLVVLEHLLENEPTFKVDYTRYGNPKAGSYDKADSIVMARAGQEIVKKGLDIE